MSSLSTQQGLDLYKRRVWNFRVFCNLLAGSCQHRASFLLVFVCSGLICEPLSSCTGAGAGAQVSLSLPMDWERLFSVICGCRYSHTWVMLTLLHPVTGRA
jgi:hypothetical protein